MSGEIIQFSAAARPARPVSDKSALTPWQQRREGKPELPPPTTETAKNHHMRVGRREAWRQADGVTCYWRGRIDWHSVLSLAAALRMQTGFPRSKMKAGMRSSRHGARLS